MRRFPLARFDPWEEDLEKVKRAWSGIDWVGVLALLTGMGIVAQGFITGEPHEWPLDYQKWVTTVTAGLLALTRYLESKKISRRSAEVATLTQKVSEMEKPPSGSPFAQM